MDSMSNVEKIDYAAQAKAERDLVSWVTKKAAIDSHRAFQEQNSQDHWFVSCDR
jgi:hypothetical protein